ncbi:MAG: hypothetical protein M3503_04155 [Actinomycetota bacterium]|nr:hypothetical protein [Actinomycetota bacterium]
MRTRRRTLDAPVAVPEVRRRQRRGRRVVVLGALGGAVAAYRKQRLDAADAAFPKASARR